MGDAGDMLQVESLATGYGKKPVVRDVSLHVGDAEIVAMIGHNGAGKSTLLKAIFGLLPLWSGRVVLNGQMLHSHTPRELLKAGVSYVPQGNRVFADLTVYENLQIGGITLDSKASVQEGIDRVISMFPTLRSRLKQRAGTLSGGEKQMVALGNALMLTPRLVLLDEPSLGLAPQLAAEALQRVQQISKDSGTAVLIVEQKVREVLKIAQRVYVLRNGHVTFTGSAMELEDDSRLRKVYL